MLQVGLPAASEQVGFLRLVVFLFSGGFLRVLLRKDGKNQFQLFIFMFGSA